MSDRNGGRFEGMVLAKLASLEERVDETLDCVRAIQDRCALEQAERASLMAEVQAIREKADFNARVIWSAVAWIAVVAVSILLAALGIM